MHEKIFIAVNQREADTSVPSFHEETGHITATQAYISASHPIPSYLTTITSKHLLIAEWRAFNSFPPSDMP